MKLYNYYAIIISITISSLFADGLKDNIPESVRRIPKLGITVNPEKRKELTTGLNALDALIQDLKKELKGKTAELITDIEIYHKAVYYGLTYNEFLSAHNIKQAEQLLIEGINRARALKNGNAPWMFQSGAVVRAFKSKIDGSIQPYYLEIPPNYFKNKAKKHRLDIWLHGRGETQLEVSFISKRKKLGKYPTENHFTLHPYGRYSNAFKFAGEVDVFEALDHVKKSYNIDSNRIANRGFSMGGAGCWQLAVHYPDQWFVSTPGAGFSETAEFLKIFQKQDLNPTWFEKKLWHLYDCTDYVINLNHCPTIAYSGELDRQKQAADIMAKAHLVEKMTLNHVIGPKTQHQIHPESLQKIQSWVSDHEIKGRDNLPSEIHFATWTLKYNKLHWIHLDRITEHWLKAQIDAVLKNEIIEIKTVNVDSFHFEFKQDKSLQFTSVTVDGQAFKERLIQGKNKQYMFFIRKKGKWELGREEKLLTKRHNLQGPIDDAFMDSFIIVTPSHKSVNNTFTTWASSESTRAIKHWRQHFRGDAIVKSDKDLTMADIMNNNLILWGDPKSNAYIGKLIDKLPIQWTDKSITVGNKQYDSDTHGLIMIYPNPLNPVKYIVLNSGFTFRDYAYLNNARQVPMLPDWAIVDLKTKANTIWPGKIVNAGFFNEFWEIKK